MTNKLPGGKGDTANLRNFDPNELAMGLEVEREHASDPEIAREITMDHLTEDPHYYSKLKAAGLADELDGDENKEKRDKDRMQIGCETVNRVKNLADFAKLCQVEITFESNGTYSILEFEDFVSNAAPIDKASLIGRIAALWNGIDQSEVENSPILSRISNFFKNGIADLAGLSNVNDFDLTQAYSKLSRSQRLPESNISLIISSIAKSVIQKQPSKVFETHTHARRYFDGTRISMRALHEMDSCVLASIAAKFK